MVLALVLSFAMAGTEGPEVVDHRLVDEHVAVGQEQDALLPAGLPQPPDDLEGGVGLAGAGRHDQQDAVLALGDGLDRRVDGVDLVVARGLAAAVVVIVLKDDLLGFRRQALPGAISRPQIAGDGKRRARGSFRWQRCAGAVVEHEAVAVRGKDEGDVERRRRIRAPAACRRRRCGCCPWPRSAPWECWACSRGRSRRAWPCPRLTSLPRTMMRPLVKLTSSRICGISSQPACLRRA